MSGSRIAVVGALTANIAISVAKFVGAGATGSSAMLSEAIHSAVDSGNELLLLYGMRLAARPADERHPFGSGKEIYFWSLIVAVLIFGVGGGLSVYQGLQRLFHPRPLEDVGWSYAILAFAFVFEGASFLIAVREFKATVGEASVWKSLPTAKDPAIYTVIAEDGAALLGLLTAAIGVYGSQALGVGWPDAIASVVIGGLLCSVSVLLIRQSHKLLVGEAVDKPMADEIRRIAQGEATVHRAAWPLTMHLGPDDVLLAIDVEFLEGVSLEHVGDAVNRIEQAVRDRFPTIKRIYIEPRRVSRDAAKPLAPSMS